MRPPCRSSPKFARRYGRKGQATLHGRTLLAWFPHVATAGCVCEKCVDSLRTRMGQPFPFVLPPEPVSSHDL